MVELMMLTAVQVNRQDPARSHVSSISSYPTLPDAEEEKPAHRAGLPSKDGEGRPHQQTVGEKQHIIL